jgi:dUTP pyrophosphatase
VTVPALKVRRLRERAVLPRYHSEQASGLDLSAALEAPLTLEPLQRAAVATGIAVEIPSGYEGQVRARSGRALSEGLSLVNAPGTIDSDYRGEVKVLVINLGERRLTINPGERIAQLVIAPVARVQVVEDEIGLSNRGEGGFGHTGR